MRWTRPVINFTLDAFALVVLLSVLWTRILTYAVVPAAGEDGEPILLWGWTHSTWESLNFWLTMGFTVVILVHLILHWTWVSQFVYHRVRRFTGSKGALDSGTQTVYGVAFMIAIFVVLGGLLMLAAVMAKPIAASG